MESRSHAVYDYRSWARLARASAWIVLGPLMGVVVLESLLHPDTWHFIPVSGMPWIWWLVPLMIGERTFIEMHVVLSLLNERVLVEGSRLEYIDVLRRRRVAVDLDQIEGIDKLRGGKWQVFTSQGRFAFSDKLRGHQQLLATFERGGIPINDFSGRRS